MPRTAAAFALVLLLLLATGAVGQDPPKWAGPGDGEEIPGWIFWWQFGLTTAACSALTWTIKVLWSKSERAERGRREDAEKFRVDEREQLKLCLTTFREVIEALRENTREIRSLTGTEEE
jgi:hypothetical protein